MAITGSGTQGSNNQHASFQFKTPKIKVTGYQITSEMLPKTANVLN